MKWAEKKEDEKWAYWTMDLEDADFKMESIIKLTPKEVDSIFMGVINSSGGEMSFTECPECNSIFNFNSIKIKKDIIEVNKLKNIDEEKDLIHPAIDEEEIVCSCSYKFKPEIYNKIKYVKKSKVKKEDWSTKIIH